MVTDRDYKPHPVPDWSSILAGKDAEIAKLREMVDNMRYADDQNTIKLLQENIRLTERVKALEAALYAQERQSHVDMGR